MLIDLLKPCAALVLFAITLLRLPVIFDRSRSHAAWLGTLLGAFALSINPVFITEYEVDALLGGHNWFHLVRNVLVLGAMWFLRVALLEALQMSPRFRRQRRVEAMIAIVVYSLMTFSFWGIDKSVTSMAFIPEHIDQLPALVYGTVYMAAAAGLMFDTSRRVLGGLREKRRRPARVQVALSLVCAGALSMGIASVIECLYMAADHLHATDGRFIMVTHAAFGPLYLSGAGLLAPGRSLPSGPSRGGAPGEGGPRLGRSGPQSASSAGSLQGHDRRLRCRIPWGHPSLLQEEQDDGSRGGSLW